ncbi:MAG TPA: DNA mismatch repair endonuclease MutL [Nitrospira sp.]|nr:DNA mismatch repair endonuclease MutL [Nitrospira sp.]
MLKTDGGTKIRVLPDDVIGRIAAGEVVERPAAVVKELLENSIDAGSRSISIEVKDGGLSLIRVTDDGEGMSRPDAICAFQRHATSKMRSDMDLWSIRTMGFRGEALASIAAVAHVRLLTATSADEVGTKLEVVRGLVGSITDAPPVHGTRIEVMGLFAQQPARKKFLKSAPTECTHIIRAVQQAALAWPTIHFRFSLNAQELLNYPTVRSERERIAQVYPRAFLDHGLPLNSEQPGANLTGYIVDAVHAKPSRIPQEVFVNRRPVRNLTVSHAVGEGYGSFLPRGCHPRFVLFLELDPERVDVNVHPTKREVRFSDNECIHQLVRRAVRQRLSGAGEVQGAGDTERSDRISPQIAVSWTETAGRGATDSPEAISSPPVSSERQLVFVSEAAEAYVRVPSTEVVALGQINRTFLVTQVGGNLVVVDQHTAHERVLFERLYRGWTSHSLQAQPLLLPESLDLTPDHAALIRRHQEDLEKLGLEIEPFGVTTVLLRSTPVGLGPVDPKMFLEDLLEDLIQWERVPAFETRVRSVLASLACHGAVRAGRSMKLDEIKRLVEEWRSEGEITTCPHGRRTSFRLSTDDLEKMFGRVGW